MRLCDQDECGREAAIGSPSCAAHSPRCVTMSFSIQPAARTAVRELAAQNHETVSRTLARIVSRGMSSTTRRGETR